MLHPGVCESFRKEEEEEDHQHGEQGTPHATKKPTLRKDADDKNTEWKCFVLFSLEESDLKVERKKTSAASLASLSVPLFRCFYRICGGDTLRCRSMMDRGRNRASGYDRRISLQPPSMLRQKKKKKRKNKHSVYQVPALLGLPQLSLSRSPSTRPAPVGHLQR